MNKPPKITYLLGAGASYNSLPIVNELPQVAKGMIAYIEYMSKYHLKKPDVMLPTFNKVKELIEEVRKHHSIDTLARKIWIKNKAIRTNGTDDEYRNIVNLITAILYFKQIRKTKPQYLNDENKNGYNLSGRKSINELIIDPRYEAFFAAILSEDCTLPDNFNFISWNYDFQIEKTLHYYNSNLKISDVAATNKIHYEDFLKTEDSSQILKLNGTSFFKFNNEIIDNTDYDFYSQGLLIEALSDNSTTVKNFKSLIKFAWENESEISNHHAIASQKIKESDFVVVIGYSFPIFNRQVDIELFKNFRIGKSKIIIQAPEGDVKQYIEQLESIKSRLSEDAIPITNLDQFYIPNEFWTSKPNTGTRVKSYSIQL